MTSELILLEDSLEAVNEAFYQRGWTDGLPIVPPTEERVRKMLEGTTRDPQEVVGEVPPAQGEATVENIAINAVMAGCLPAYMPVLIAAVEAMTQPQFNLYGIQATTNSNAPLTILNGPLRRGLGINCGHNCLGQGWRANATIGRALRLILLNVGGGIPATVDKATQGQPGKYSFCFGENEEESPWEPLHVERGFPQETSTVTTVGACGTLDIQDPFDKRAEGLLKMIAGSMTAIGVSNYMHPGDSEPLLVLCPEHASILARGGLSKMEVKARLYEMISVPVSSFSEEVASARIARWGWAKKGRISPVKTPEQIMIVVAGGAGIHSVFLPTSQGVSVIRPIAG